MFKKVKTENLEIFEKGLRERLSKIKNCPLAVRRVHYLAKAELLKRELKIK